MHPNQHKAPLYAASAVTMIVGDALLFLGNGPNEPTISAGTFMGALLTGSLVSGIERRTASAQLAALKGCTAALLVGLPYPVLGTLTGLVALVWAMRAPNTMRSSY
jgi:hypothetical protein